MITRYSDRAYGHTSDRQLFRTLRCRLFMCLFDSHGIWIYSTRTKRLRQVSKSLFPANARHELSRLERVARSFGWLGTATLTFQKDVHECSAICSVLLSEQVHFWPTLACLIHERGTDPATSVAGSTTRVSTTSGELSRPMWAVWSFITPTSMPRLFRYSS
jgi:hypothetical protein